MQFTRVTTAGTRAAQQPIPSAQATRLNSRALSTGLYVHQQADQVLANKEVHDSWEDKYAASLCGCPQCRHAYRRTLVYYAKLNARRSACADLRASGRT
jgi:hypothetical protein